MNWNEIWTELREELGREPTNGEVMERLLDKFFGKENELV
jgi:hypothetical protein